MRKFVTALPLLLALGGCAGGYAPETLEVDDSAQYAADVKFCLAAGANYKAKLDLGEVGYQTVKGATSNATGAVVGGLTIPAIGAASSGTTQLLTDLDVMGRAGANVARHCLTDKTNRDHSAILANPND